MILSTYMENPHQNAMSSKKSSEMSNQRGVRPVRACGTRFAAHKVSAINQVIDRYGAYLSHLTSSTEAL